MPTRHRQIEAFRFVMMSGTTTEAATLMSVSQPAISRLISDLEAELNIRLFDRFRGRLVPTEEARRFFHGVERYFVGLDELAQVAEEIRTQRPTELKVCATPAMSTYAFPRAIPRLRAEHPNVGIMIENLTSSEIVSRLQAHLTHLGLTIGFPETPGIVQEHLIDLPHVCALHESHPLTKKDVIGPDDLKGENVLRILPVSTVNWNAARKVLRDADIEFTSNLGIQNSHTGYSLIAANLAVGLIEPFASDAWRGNGVVTRPFEPAVNFRYVMAYSENQPEPAAMQPLVEHIRAVFEKAGEELGCYA